MHISCTICIDLVEANEALTSTKCGHLFHHHCLTDWIKRSNTCPQCRNPLTLNCISQIYPTFTDESCTQITTLQASLDEKCMEISTLKSNLDQKSKEISTLKSNLDEKCVEIRSLESFLEDKSVEIATLQSSLDEKILEITNIQNNLDKALQELDNFQDVCKEKESLLSKASEDLTRNEESLEAFSSELDYRNEEVAELKRKLECAEKLNKTNECLKNNAEAVNRTLERQNLALVSQISSQKDSIDLQTTETARLKDENESLKKNLQNLCGELQRQRIINEEFMIQISLQKDALEINSDEVEQSDEKHQQHESLNDETETLKGQTQKMMSDVELSQNVRKSNDDNVNSLSTETKTLDGDSKTQYIFNVQQTSLNALELKLKNEDLFLKCVKEYGSLNKYTKNFNGQLIRKISYEDIMTRLSHLIDLEVVDKPKRRMSL